MNSICVCIDLDGFYVHETFVVRELGWSNGLRSGCNHYDRDINWVDLTTKDQRTVRYVQRYVTGLPIHPSAKERRYGPFHTQSDVMNDILHVWDQFKTPTCCTVAFKGGHVEKDFFSAITHSLC